MNVGCMHCPRLYKRQLNIARGIGLYGKASFQSLSFTNHLYTKFYRYSASISSCCRHCFAVFRFVNCILYCSKSKLEPCYTFMSCSNDNALLNESSSSLVLSSHQSVSYFGTLANATCVWSWHQMHFHLVYVNYIISFGPPLAEATSSHSDKNRSSRKGEAPKTSTMLNQSQYILDSTLSTTRVTSL